MKSTLYIPKGLPASGKSTWARKKVLNEDGVYIVSRDSIREMLAADYKSFPFGHSELEQVVTEGVLEMVTLLLSLDYSVILDETNLNQGRLSKLINEVTKDLEVVNPTSEFTVEHIDFTNVPLEECIKRDQERERTVGKHVIKGMHKKYLAHESPHKNTT